MDSQLANFRVACLCCSLVYIRYGSTRPIPQVQRYLPRDDGVGRDGGGAWDYGGRDRAMGAAGVRGGRRRTLNVVTAGPRSPRAGTVQGAPGQHSARCLEIQIGLLEQVHTYEQSTEEGF